MRLQINYASITQNLYYLEQRTTDDKWKSIITIYDYA